MDPGLGGDFAALVLYGRRYQVATRLAGDPDIDWGALLPCSDPSARDAYQVRIAGFQRAGHVDRRRL